MKIALDQAEWKKKIHIANAEVLEQSQLMLILVSILLVPYIHILDI